MTESIWLAQAKIFTVRSLQKKKLPTSELKSPARDLGVGQEWGKESVHLAVSLWIRWYGGLASRGSGSG